MRKSILIFIVRWQPPCGSGFPAATIEIENLFHKKPNLLADILALGVRAR
jgi:hypothetical protein